MIFSSLRAQRSNLVPSAQLIEIAASCCALLAMTA